MSLRGERRPRGARNRDRPSGQIIRRAAFNGTQDTVVISWPATKTNPPKLIPGAPTITDGSGGVAIWLTNTSSTGATVNTSARFSGTVDIAVFDE
jgi:hypothetical protein